MRTIGILLLLLSAAAAGQTTASAPATAPAAVRVTVLTVEGDAPAGELLAMDADGARLRVDGRERSVPIAEILEVRLAAEVPGPVSAPAGGAVITTLRGCRLPGRDLRFGEGGLRLATELLGEVRLPVDRLHAVLLPSGDASAERLAEALPGLSLPVRAQDYLVVRSDSGEYIPLGGVVQAIADGQITFRYDGQDRPVELSRVAIIRFAQTAAPPPAAKGHVVGRQGERVAFDGIAFDGTRWRLAGSAAGDVAVPADAPAAVVLRNDNLVFLSELEPASVEQAATFDAIFPLRRDRAAAGGPLQLGGRTYARGLGLHSRCLVRYDLGGQYRLLTATVGIDDAARPRGDATLSVIGDGRTLLEPVRLTGADEPRPVRLDVAGVQTLTITVDFGAAMDVGDHVDLADAKLVR